MFGMKFQEGEFIRVKTGDNDRGHGGELGIVIQINPNPVTGVVIDVPIDQIDMRDAESYVVGFPPNDTPKERGYFAEEQLEAVKVFISHDPKDFSLAEKVASVLQEAGFKDVWDYRRILPGDNWAEKTSQALKESIAMVVLLTPDSLESSIVSWDIGFALGEESYEERLIPVIVGNPEQMPEEKIPWILRRLKLIMLPEQGRDAESLKQIALAVKEVALKEVALKEVA